MKITRQKLYIFYMVTVIAFSMLLLLPVLRLSFYNHPSADDYLYASSTYNKWYESHSVAEIMKTAASDCIETYKGWQGTYVSCFLFELQPAIFGERYYFITTFIMLMSIWGGNFVVIYYLMRKCIKTGMLEMLSVWALVSSYMTQFIPSPVQGLYWYNGSLHYVFFYGFLTCLITIYLSLIFSNDKTIGLIYKALIGAILALIVAGGNYLSALLSVIISVLAVISVFFLRKYKSFATALFVAIASFTGFFINVLAPGNKVRQAQYTYTSMSPVKAILASVYEGILNIDRWFSLSTVLFLVSLIPIFQKAVSSIKYKVHYKYVIMLVIMFTGLICAMYTPPMYAMGFADDGRVVNLIWCVFVLFLTVAFFCLLLTIRSKIESIDNGFVNKVKESGLLVSRVSIVLTLVLYIGLLFICMKNSVAYKAFNSIASGKAYEYDRAANERVLIYLSSENEDVTVGPFSVKPELLFYDDITENPDGWQNTTLSRYYKLNSVQLYHN